MNENEERSADAPVGPKRKKFLKFLGASLALLAILAGLYIGYVFIMSPTAIRQPALEHLHFRMQILVDGKAENFAEAKYQQSYSEFQCTDGLPEQPIHFHDEKDQFVHIHWKHMTGGMVMKYYGWNYIGGQSDSLGYRLDALPLKKVPIHGNTLPAVPQSASFYVYVGDMKGYQEKSFEDWKNQDIETFFGKSSNFLSDQSHGSSKEEELTVLNNLIGNVVIFVRKDKPTDSEIKARFDKLVPLSESTCGG